MEILSIVLSGLALCVAAASFTISLVEVNRNKKRNTALLHLIDESVKECKGYADGCAEFSNDYADKAVAVESDKLAVRIKNLEDGITPNYEQAKIAADAVNDFNKGITSILNFDPVTALQSKREKDEE